MTMTTQESSDEATDSDRGSVGNIGQGGAAISPGADTAGKCIRRADTPQLYLQHIPIFDALITQSPGTSTGLDG